MEEYEEVAELAAHNADRANDAARVRDFEDANQYAALSEKLGRTALFLALAGKADNLTPAERREMLRALRG